MRYLICMTDTELEYNTDRLHEALRVAETVVNFTNKEALIIDKEKKLIIKLDKLRKV